MSDQPARLEIWQRADISPRELALLKGKARRLLEVMKRIQEMAAEDIRMDVVTRKSSIWQIEADARAAVEEAGK